MPLKTNKQLKFISQIQETWYISRVYAFLCFLSPSAFSSTSSVRIGTTWHIMAQCHHIWHASMYRKLRMWKDKWCEGLRSDSTVSCSVHDSWQPCVKLGRLAYRCWGDTTLASIDISVFFVGFFQSQASEFFHSGQNIKNCLKLAWNQLLRTISD